MYIFLSKYVHFDKYLLCWACLYLIWSRGGGLFTPSSQGGISIQRGTSIRGGTFIYFWFIVQGVLLLRRVCLFGTIEYFAFYRLKWVELDLFWKLSYIQVVSIKRKLKFFEKGQKVQFFYKNNGKKVIYWFLAKKCFSLEVFDRESNKISNSESKV